MNLKKSNSFHTLEETIEVEEIHNNIIKRSISFKIPKWNLKKSNSFTVVEETTEAEEIQNNTSIKRSVSFKVPKWKETKEVQSIVPRTNSFWPKSTRQRLFLPYFAIPCHQHSNEIQINSMIRLILNKNSKSRLKTTIGIRI